MLRNRSWSEFVFLVLTKRKAGSGDEIVVTYILFLLRNDIYVKNILFGSRIAIYM